MQNVTLNKSLISDFIENVSTWHNIQKLDFSKNYKFFKRNTKNELNFTIMIISNL